jgi:hypothetical protein
VFPSLFHHAGHPIHPNRPLHRPVAIEDDGSAVTIRLAGDDEPSVALLAELDGRALPTGPRLVAEISGRPVAAVALVDGAAVADPFWHSAPFVELLRLRAGQLAR